MIFDDQPWFAPKRFGYGAGMPIAWQGWVMLAAHMALLFGVSVLLQRHPLAMILSLIFVAFAPLPLYARKTRGGWQWRWHWRSGAGEE
jgi:hypothetical protein